MFRFWNRRERPVEPSSDRLDSWKEIATYLRRDVRTVHRWEEAEDLPIHRHHHKKLATVYAYRSELDAWWNNRQSSLGNRVKKAELRNRALKVTGVSASMVVIFALAWWVYDSVYQEKQSPFAVEEPAWVLITDFKNATGNQILKGSLEYALQLELSNSEMIRVVSRPRIEDTLKLMKRPVDSPIDLSLGKEICIRDGGIKLVITGAIEKLDSQYLLSVQIVDPFQIVPTRSTSRRAEGEAAIPDRIHELAAWSRRSLGETIPELKGDQESLQKVTTPSLKALRLFTLQDQLQREGNNDAAVGLLRAAIAEDPEFASAYAWLAFALLETGRPHEEALESVQKAVDLSEGVSEWERYHILGSCHELNEEWELGLPYWEALCVRYPDELWGYAHLEYGYTRTGRTEQLADLAVNLATLRPNDLISNWEAARALSRFYNDPRRAEPYWEKSRTLGDRETSERLPYRWAQAQLYPGTGYWLENQLDQSLKVLEEAVTKLDSLKGMPRAALALEAALQYIRLGRLRNAQALASMLDEPERSHILSLVFLAGGPKYKAREARPSAVSVISLARRGYVVEAKARLTRLETLWALLPERQA